MFLKILFSNLRKLFINTDNPTVPELHSNG